LGLVVEEGVHVNETRNRSRTRRTRTERKVTQQSRTQVRQKEVTDTGWCPRRRSVAAPESPFGDGRSMAHAQAGESTTAEVVEAVPGGPAIAAERRGCHDGSLTGYSRRDGAHEDRRESRYVPAVGRCSVVVSSIRQGSPISSPP